MAANNLCGMSPAVTETLRAFYVENRQQLYTYAVSITRQREAAEAPIQQTFQQLLHRRALAADLRPYLFRCLPTPALAGLPRPPVPAATSLSPPSPPPDPSPP